MLKLWLIRHSLTQGNLKKRYIGITDEPLCEEGRKLLKTLSLPCPEMVFASPLRRCVESARILFPGMEIQEISELSECNFGEFENKNYQELSENPHYQAWINSNGTAPFPGGESREEFRERTLCGFDKVVEECIQKGTERAALVVHGGTIMNIMEAYAKPSKSFYEWHVDNGGFYEVCIEKSKWRGTKKHLKLCL
ncbi:MAG: histidine phosphatase family protein [Eubacteriales bacterium]|nr:histidine phosphatase family protein [Eubacteriales bacterium]